MIYDEERFNEWLPAGYDGRFEWDFLKPAFEGTKIMPMDIDAVIHKDGPHGDQFLFFETKAPGATIPRGQVITYCALLKETNKVLFFLEGKTPASIQGLTIYIDNLRDGYYVLPATPQFVLAMTRRWMRWAIGGFPGEDEFWVEYDNQVIREHREHLTVMYSPRAHPFMKHGDDGK